VSYTSIDICVRDTDLQARVRSAASKEAWAGGPEFAGSEYGNRLRTYPDEALITFMYAIAIDNEADYQYALDSNNEAPGKDPGVISDAKIQAGVQTHWPTAPAPPPTDMTGPTPGSPSLAKTPDTPEEGP
jgi:hypothetical protein